MPSPKPKWEDLTARDIMRTEILTVSLNTPLSEVESLLGEYRIGGLPVTDEVGHIVGIVSMRDLIERYAQSPESRPHGSGSEFYHLHTSEGLDDDLQAFVVPEESQETAGDIMTPQVYSVQANDGLAEIAKRMVQYNIHRILVTEQNRKIGFISSMDILKALAGEND